MTRRATKTLGGFRVGDRVQWVERFGNAERIRTGYVAKFAGHTKAQKGWLRVPRARVESELGWLDEQLSGNNTPGWSSMVRIEKLHHAPSATEPMSSGGSNPPQ